MSHLPSQVPVRILARFLHPSLEHASKLGPRSPPRRSRLLARRRRFVPCLCMWVQAQAWSSKSLRYQNRIPIWYQSQDFTASFFAEAGPVGLDLAGEGSDAFPRRA